MQSAAARPYSEGADQPAEALAQCWTAPNQAQSYPS